MSEAAHLMALKNESLWPVGSFLVMQYIGERGWSNPLVLGYRMHWCWIGLTVAMKKWISPWLWSSCTSHCSCLSAEHRRGWRFCPALRGWPSVLALVTQVYVTPPAGFAIASHQMFWQLWVPSVRPSLACCGPREGGLGREYCSYGVASFVSSYSRVLSLNYSTVICCLFPGGVHEVGRLTLCQAGPERLVDLPCWQAWVLGLKADYPGVRLLV